MVSLPVKEKLYVNEVGLGAAFGVLMGPHVANAFNPRAWGPSTNTITLEVLRVVLTTSLFAIGIELPQAYMAKSAKGLIALVVPTMAFGWVIVAAVIYGLFRPLTFTASLAIAACLTPTDPVVCSIIVAGKYAQTHVPEKLRDILSAESAANDGLAYPFLTISLYLILSSSWHVAIKDWFLIGCLYQVVLGVVLGAAIGLMFSRLMKFFRKRGIINQESYIAQYVAMPLFVTGIVSTIGSDDLLAAFAAGCAISWDGDLKTQVEGHIFWSVIDLVLNCVCFVYIGAWLPFESFNTPTLGITPWRLVVLLVAVLFLRRIPVVLMLYKWIPEIDTWQQALFAGHFGPMGVSAVFVSCLALQKLPIPHDPPENSAELLAATLQPIVTFVVVGSIIIHGLSPPFLSLVNTLTYRWSIKPRWSDTQNTAWSRS